MKEIRELWRWLSNPNKNVVIDLIMKEYPDLSSEVYVRQHYFLTGRGGIPTDRISRIEEIVTEVLESQKSKLDKVLKERRKSLKNQN